MTLDASSLLDHSKGKVRRQTDPDGVRLLNTLPQLWEVKRTLWVAVGVYIRGCVSEWAVLIVLSVSAIWFLYGSKQILNISSSCFNVNVCKHKSVETPGNKWLYVFKN